MKRAAILLSLVVFFAVSCEKKEQEPQVSNVSWTPCKQGILKSGGLSDNVEVKFTNQGVQITHNNFEVPCDFTTVNVTYILVNGVLSITQQGLPNQANCVCHSDVSYTIEGISQDEVNVIFINGMQVYCYNDKPQEPCHCIMDTLKGEWIWVKKYGGFFGDTTDSEFKSIVKILGQNEDTSINYEVFVEDTLFYKGSLQILYDQYWSEYRGSAIMTLPHLVWWNEGQLMTIPHQWYLYFGDPRTQIKSRDTLCFAMGIGGFVEDDKYYYQKIK